MFGLKDNWPPRQQSSNSAKRTIMTVRTKYRTYNYLPRGLLKLNICSLVERVVSQASKEDRAKINLKPWSCNQTCVNV